MSRTHKQSKVMLYHFTNLHHIREIRESGVILATESNISMNREKAGPDVVWLTSNPDPAVNRGWMKFPPGMLEGEVPPEFKKDAIRITVKVPASEVHRWSEWAKARGIESSWMAALAAAGGSRSWRVIERPIPAEEWINIEHLT